MVDEHAQNVVNHLLPVRDFQICRAVRRCIRDNETIVWTGVVPYNRLFGSVPVGNNPKFINSSGFASIAVNQGNIAKKNGTGGGDDSLIELKK